MLLVKFYAEPKFPFRLENVLISCVAMDPSLQLSILGGGEENGRGVEIMQYRYLFVIITTSVPNPCFKWKSTTSDLEVFSCL